MTYCGIEDFEQVFEKKRALADAVDEYHNKNKSSKNSIALIQQRLSQIEHLASRAEK